MARYLSDESPTRSADRWAITFGIWSGSIAGFEDGKGALLEKEFARAYEIRQRDPVTFDHETHRTD